MVERLNRAVRAAVLNAVLLALGCGGDSASKPAAPPQPNVEPSFAAAPTAVPADQPGSAEGMRAHLNLLNLVHLADVDQGGLFVDFGTPARNKYTIGHWRTGFGKDGVEGDTTYTNASASARVYLPLAPVAQKLRLRAKPIGTQKLQLFVNGKSLPAVTLGAMGQYGVQDVELPAEVLQPGENQVLMRFGGTTKLEGEDVAVALDYLRVLPAGTGSADSAAAAAPGAPAAPAGPAGGGDGALPRYGALVQDVAIGDTKRKALVLRAPGTLNYYLEIPKGASLSLRVGAANGNATAKVRATPEGGQPSELLAHKAGASWHEQVISLAAYAGQVVRLELAGEGAGSVAWASPAIVVADEKVKAPAPVHSTVVLLIDTMRARSLRPFDAKSRVEAPAIDALAKEGTTFVNTQSPENWTKPSVASILTGLYPTTHGTKQSESKLPEAAQMLPELLKGAGVATATFLANGYVSDKFGFKQGWDFYTNYIRENKSTKAENVFKDAGDWIEKNKDKRFFVYIQTIDPHVPYDPPEAWLTKYDPEPYTGPVSPRKTADQLEQAKRNPPAINFTERDRERLRALYDAEVSYHDEELAKFVERMKKIGLWDKLMFVLTSDHGEEFNEHGSYGHGHSVYQELLHVPLMYRLPGVVPAGKRIDETVGSLDITPTVLSAMGVAIPEVVEGVDRMAHMMGSVPAGPAVAFSDFLDDRRVIQAGRWKLILNGVNPTFFDLKSDPLEQKELAVSDHPIARRYCRILLGQFLAARDRGDWLSAEQKGKTADFGTQAAEIDEATRKGLKALGYAN